MAAMSALAFERAADWNKPTAAARVMRTRRTMMEITVRSSISVKEASLRSRRIERDETTLCICGSVGLDPEGGILGGRIAIAISPDGDSPRGRSARRVDVADLRGGQVRQRRPGST